MHVRRVLIIIELAAAIMLVGIHKSLEDILVHQEEILAKVFEMLSQN